MLPQRREFPKQSPSSVGRTPLLYRFVSDLYKKLLYDFIKCITVHLL